MRERERKCNGRRCCSIQGERARLTVSQTLSLPLFSLYLQFHSPLLLPLSALKQLPPLMQGTFQITVGGGSVGDTEVGQWVGGGKRLHGYCATFQWLLKADIPAKVRMLPPTPNTPSPPSLKIHGAIH